MLALPEFHLCLARNYDYDDKIRGLSWAISLVEVNCAVDRHLGVIRIVNYPDRIGPFG
jgi:hypothetical protein